MAYTAGVCGYCGEKHYSLGLWGKIKPMLGRSPRLPFDPKLPT